MRVLRLLIKQGARWYASPHRPLSGWLAIATLVFHLGAIVHPLTHLDDLLNLASEPCADCIAFASAAVVPSETVDASRLQTASSSSDEAGSIHEPASSVLTLRIRAPPMSS